MRAWLSRTIPLLTFVACVGVSEGDKLDRFSCDVSDSPCASDPRDLLDLAVAAPENASPAFIELVSQVGEAKDADALNDLLEQAQQNGHPAVIGYLGGGWSLSVGNGEVLKLACSPKIPLRLRVSWFRDQATTLTNLHAEGYRVAQFESSVFLTQLKSGERCATAFAKQSAGVSGLVFAKQMSIAHNIREGAVLGILAQHFEYPVEMLLNDWRGEPELGEADFHPDGYDIDTPPSQLAGLFKYWEQEATVRHVWLEAEDVMERYDLSVEEQNTLGAAAVKHGDVLANMAVDKIRSRFLATNTSLSDSEISHLVDELLEAIERRLPERNQTLVNELKKHIVIVSPL